MLAIKINGGAPEAGSRPIRLQRTLPRTTSLHGCPTVAPNPLHLEFAATRLTIFVKQVACRRLTGAFTESSISFLYNI